jgi:hypothetical protein
MIVKNQSFLIQLSTRLFNRSERDIMSLGFPRKLANHLQVPEETGEHLQVPNKTGEHNLE